MSGNETTSVLVGIRTGGYGNETITPSTYRVGGWTPPGCDGDGDRN